MLALVVLTFPTFLASNCWSVELGRHLGVREAHDAVERLVEDFGVCDQADSLVLDFNGSGVRILRMVAVLSGECNRVPTEDSLEFARPKLNRTRVLALLEGLWNERVEEVVYTHLSFRLRQLSFKASHIEGWFFASFYCLRGQWQHWGEPGVGGACVEDASEGLLLAADQDITNERHVVVVLQGKIHWARINLLLKYSIRCSMCRRETCERWLSS